jgi:hypothetical protein
MGTRASNEVGMAGTVETEGEISLRRGARGQAPAARASGNGRGTAS